MPARRRIRVPRHDQVGAGTPIEHQDVSPSSISPSVPFTPDHAIGRPRVPGRGPGTSAR
jgi:hypothetical protein